MHESRISVEFHGGACYVGADAFAAGSLAGRLCATTVVMSRCWQVMTSFPTACMCSEL